MKKESASLESIDIARQVEAEAASNHADASGIDDDTNEQFVVDDLAIMAASWVISDLMLGPEGDGEIQRDEANVIVQRFLRKVFRATRQGATQPEICEAMEAIRNEALAEHRESTLFNPDGQNRPPHHFSWASSGLFNLAFGECDHLDEDEREDIECRIEALLTRTFEAAIAHRTATLDELCAAQTALDEAALAEHAQIVEVLTKEGL